MPDDDVMQWIDEAESVEEPDPFNGRWVSADPFIINESEFPGIVYGPGVKVGDYCVTYGTGEKESEAGSYYFREKADADRFIDELGDVRQVTIVVVALVRKVGRRPTTLKYD